MIVFNIFQIFKNNLSSKLHITIHSCSKSFRFRNGGRMSDQRLNIHFNQESIERKMVKMIYQKH